MISDHYDTLAVVAEEDGVHECVDDLRQTSELVAEFANVVRRGAFG